VQNQVGRFDRSLIVCYAIQKAGAGRKFFQTWGMNAFQLPLSDPFPLSRKRFPEACGTRQPDIPLAKEHDLMISELLEKALMIIAVGMGMVFCFILLMIMAIQLNAKIIKALGKDKEQAK